MVLGPKGPGWKQVIFVPAAMASLMDDQA